MSETTVPAVTTYKCDGCDREQGRQFDCKLSIKQVGRDFQGCAVGANTVERDLCHDCVKKLNEFFSAIDKDSPPPEQKP